MATPFLALAAVGIIITTVGLLRMRPLPEGSADKWLRIALLGVALLVSWAFLRDPDPGEAAVLSVCVASGVLASHVSFDRGQAAAGSWMIAALALAAGLTVLTALGAEVVNNANSGWLGDALVIVLASWLLTCIPAGTAGWLAADLRDWWTRRTAGRPRALARPR